MRDGEIGILHKNGSSLDMGRIQVAPDQKVVLSPDPYPHWTIKECLEQPAAVTAAMNNGGRLDGQCVKLGGIDRAEDKLAHMRFLTMSACGTSLHAAKYGERLMKQLRSFDGVYSVDAAETGESDFFVADSRANSGLLVVSQSGETKDVVRVVNKAQDLGMPVISIVNAVGSLIARKTQLGVYCNAGRENAVASTKAFTTQVTVLSLIALWFRQARDREENRPIGSGERSAKLRAALLALPGTLRIAMDTRDRCKEVAELLRSKEHCFVLGKGFAEPVALEGALKIKEMCYLHAEGYSGGALKHGPFALIDDETGRFGATPVILLIFDDQHADNMRTCGEEVKARGAQLIIITDNESLARDLDPNPIVIPSNGPLTALGAVIPLQLLSYELSLIRYVTDVDVPVSSGTPAG
jgi:glucosamine--fructose-6-phosphate aminotransferase (isomerizing)